MRPVADSDVPGAAAASGEAAAPVSRSMSAGAVLRREVFLDGLKRAARAASERAAALDCDGAFPADDIAALAAAGALKAPLPKAQGGLALGLLPETVHDLMDVLRLVGHASLPLGRLYEGHVNALTLIARYGAPSQLARAAEDVEAGRLFGVWNTEAHDGLRLRETADGLRLQGRKTFASGAGFVERALVTAKTETDETFMIVPRLAADDLADRADLSEWRAHGMRASATGSFDFTGVPVAAADIIGESGDYLRQPAFAAGAWRFCAVQLGGIERLLDETRAHLVAARRGGDPHQLARIGQAAMAVETARLWVAKAAVLAVAPRREGDQIVAYVNLARSAVERIGLDVLEHAQRSIGLAAFARRHPIERVGRDLATYLRQPGPDRALVDAASFVIAAPVPTADLWR